MAPRRRPLIAQYKSRRWRYRARCRDNSVLSPPKTNMARASNLTMCSFCGKSHAEVRKLIAGPGVYICDSCINVCKSILDMELNEDARRQSSNIRAPKPADIRRSLDQYVIGQEIAKKTLSVAVHNHFKRVMQNATPTDTSAAFQPDPFAEVEIEKSNILLIGPTGSGKTLLAKTLAKILFVCGGAFIGLDKIVQKRIGNKTMGFSSPTLEVEEAMRKEAVRHVEPEDLLSFGMIPEFIGRLPVLAALDALTEDEMVSILTETKNAMVKQYTKLFSMEGVRLTVTKDALRGLAAQAVTKGTGARALRSMLEGVMLDIMVEVPIIEDIELELITRS